MPGATRVTSNWPMQHTKEDGGHVPNLLRRAHQSENFNTQKKSKDSIFQDKHATMPDAAMQAHDNIFQGTSPNHVTDDRYSSQILDHETKREATFCAGGQLAIQVGGTFQEQFVGKYLSRVFPWSLNFMTGGPEYPEFYNNAADEKVQKWRRKPEAPRLLPGHYAANLARRCEAQIASDWLRNNLVERNN